MVTIAGGGVRGRQGHRSSWCGREGWHAKLVGGGGGGMQPLFLLYNIKLIIITKKNQHGRNS